MCMVCVDQLDQTCTCCNKYVWPQPSEQPNHITASPTPKPYAQQPQPPTHLDHQVILLLVQVGALAAHHQIEQLRLQALLLDCKVDQHDLGGHLGCVVGVGQLGGDVQLEFRADIHLLVPDLHQHLVAAPGVTKEVRWGEAEHTAWRQITCVPCVCHMGVHCLHTST
jgi:hypothetical protein